MNNQFAIAPLKVLNGSYNTLQVYGAVPLFSEEFSVNWTLSNITPSTANTAAPAPVDGSTTTHGTATVKRAELDQSLSIEAAVVAAVAQSIGAKLVK